MALISHTVTVSSSMFSCTFERFGDRAGIRFGAPDKNVSLSHEISPDDLREFVGALSTMLEELDEAVSDAEDD